MYGLTLFTAPTIEPISLLEVKRQVELAEDYTEHDSELQGMIQAARIYAEKATNRQICTATWDYYSDRFPFGLDVMLLPLAPLQSITYVKYLDSAGTLTTWNSSNYVVTTSREPGYLSLVYGSVFPQTRFQRDAVNVRFVAGYGGQANVPQDLKLAMLRLVNHWFVNKSAVVVGSISKELEHSVDDILEKYRVADDFIAYGRELHDGLPSFAPYANY